MDKPEAYLIRVKDGWVILNFSESIVELGMPPIHPAMVFSAAQAVRMVAGLQVSVVSEKDWMDTVWINGAELTETYLMDMPVQDK